MFKESYFEKFNEEIESYISNYWPEITEYDLLWHEGYYDGMLSGVLEFSGQKCYFFLVSEAERKVCPLDDTCGGDETNCPEEWKDICCKDGFRYFAVVPLTEKEWNIKKKNQLRFEKFVGNHTCYPAWNKSKRYLQPEKLWQKFYNSPLNVFRIPPKINLEKSYDRIIGWFKY